MLPTTDKTKEAIKELIIKLDSASFEVEQYYFSKNTCEYMWRTYGELFGHLLQPMLPLPLRVLFRYIGKFIGKDIISKATFSKLLVGEKSYEKVLQQREEAIAIIDTLFNNHDVFICPVSSSPAFKHRKIGQIHTSVDVDGAMIPGNIAGIGYTAIFNLTGHPAVVIPVTKSDNGLPIGLQIVGKRGEDDKLLMICEQIEQYIGM
jgi:Asp-tRNA(Asn)/Glu-tRNA(Gln) amidotransferase A subunit family amidase